MAPSNFENITGRKFGKLTVIKRVENTKQGRARWLCKCDCGNEKIVEARSLKSKSTQSCGCSRKKKRTVFSLQLGGLCINISLKKPHKKLNKTNIEVNNEDIVEI